jgi:cell division protein FtsX
MSDAPPPGATNGQPEANSVDPGPLRPIVDTASVPDIGPPVFGRSAVRPTLLGTLAAVLRRTCRVLIDRPRATLWTAIALVAALFVAGAAAVAAMNIDTWTRAPAGRASVVVYLAGNVDAAHGAALADELAHQRWVDRVEYVPAAETARRLEAALGYDASARPGTPRPVAGGGASEGRASQPQLLDGVDLAGLPATIELTLVPGVRDVVAMSPTARGLRDTPGVDDVVVEDGGEDRAASALASVRVVGWSASMVVLGVALVIALATIRVWLDRGQRELAIARLLGAGAAYAAAPCALAGMMLGAIAAAVAVAVVYAAVAKYGDDVAATLAPALGTIDVAVPAAGDVVTAIAAVAVLGVIGGALAGVGWTGADRYRLLGGCRDAN